MLPLLPLSDAARLRESAGSGYLFGAYAVYNETTYKQILDDSLLELALDRQTPFLFLLSETGCSLQTQHRVWNYIRQQRIQQQWPLFPLEYKMDMAYIDQVVIPQSADRGESMNQPVLPPATARLRCGDQDMANPFYKRRGLLTPNQKPTSVV